MNDLFLFAVLGLHSLPSVLCKAWHFCWCWRWKVERVIEDQVERSPCGYFPRTERPSRGRIRSTRYRHIELGRLCQSDIIVIVLANPVDHRTNIKTLHPRVSCAVIEQPKIGSMPWQRTC